MARDLFEERGISVGSNKPRDLFAEKGIQIDSENPVMSAITGFNTGIERNVHGLLQPLFESGYLGENWARGSREVASNRERDYEKSKEANPISAESGQLGGQLAAFLPAASVGGGAAGAILPKLAPNFIKSLFAGIAGGAAQGGAQYTSPEEDRLGNAIEGGVYGGVAGSIPGMSQAIKGAFKYGKTAANSFPAKKVAEKVVSDRGSIKEAFNKRYNNLFSKGEEAGVTEIKVPKINTDRIIGYTTKKQNTGLKEFIQNPSLRNAHSADKDLGKVIRNFEKLSESRGLHQSEIKALDAARSAQNKIEKSIIKAFDKKGAPHLGKEYKEIKQDYLKEYIPYKNKNISAYMKGELTDKDLIKGLNRDKKFNAQLSEKYPEVSINANLPKALGYGGAGIGGAYYLKDLASLFGEKKK